MQDTASRSVGSSSGQGSSGRISSQSSDISTTTATPDQIVSILLADGWHDVQDCEFTHFAIAEGMSPPQPSKLYAALSYTDKKSGKQVVTTLRNVLATSFSETYKNNR